MDLLLFLLTTGDLIIIVFIIVFLLFQMYFLDESDWLILIKTNASGNSRDAQLERGTTKWRQIQYVCTFLQDISCLINNISWIDPFQFMLQCSWFLTINLLFTFSVQECSVIWSCGQPISKASAKLQTGPCKVCLKYNCTSKCLILQSQKDENYFCQSWEPLPPRILVSNWKLFHDS